MTIHAQIKRRQYDMLGRVLIGSLIAIAAALISFSGTLPSSAGNPSVEVLATPKATATPGGPELAELEATFTVGDIGQFAHPPSVSVQRVEPDGTVVILDEGFEGAWSPPGWAAQPNWGASSCRASAGSKSAWVEGSAGLACGSDYYHDENAFLIYGPFSLADATAASLTYQLWLNTEYGDYLCSMASLNGLDFYGTCRYGTSGGWVQDDLDLTDVYFLGDVTRSPSVWIAFVFVSDESDTRAEGAYLDDIVLSAYVVARPPTTLTVCLDGSCDYTSIQDAIDEAIYGDVISVAAGTYRETIAMKNGIKIEGVGVGQSIIDGDGSWRVVKAYGASITDEAALEAFTITGGVAPTSFNVGGGALIESGASPTLIGNEITGNTALNGAGIGIMYGASPDIRDNVISGNSTTGGPGGGIYVFNSSPAIIGNTIAGNTGINGGGIHARVESYPTIVNNTVVSNTASGDGGGMWIGGWSSYAAGGILTGNTIRANTATYGGGIQIETNSSVTLSNNTILSNTVDQNGGGIYVTRNSSLISSEDIISRNAAVNGGGLAVNDNSLATMSKATISDNRANGDGGGIHTPWVGDCVLRLSNSTVASNAAANQGGGMYIGRDTSATIQATTIVSNSASVGGGIYLDGNASFIGNTITDNEASGSTYSSHGGGIYAYTYASFTLSRNTILRNTADHDGGGIYIDQVMSPTLSDNIIQSNVAEDGGGIYVQRSEQLAFSGNIIADNRAVHAGGIYFDNSAGVLNNNVIAGNVSSATGGGIYVDSSVSCTPPCPTAPNVSNNTIVANNVSGSGEGIYLWIYGSSQDAPVITNNIIVSHTYGIYGGGAGSQGTLLSYNNVWGNSEADYYGVTPGPGSISADPLFVSGPRGEYYLSQVAAGQDVDSPCVDVGSDMAANLGLDDRTTRTDEVPDSGTVDMGYHFTVTTPMLEVTKQADPDPVQAGAPLTYTLRVTNTGNVDLHATVSDTLPAQVTPGGVLTWTPTITAPGGVWTEQVVVTVTTDYSGTLTNVVQVTTDEGATGVYTETSEAASKGTDIYYIYLPLVLKNH